ncbi:hypothetical protein CAI21_08700 [Alkalilimnicola ehrlichii]|uniref:YrhK domain-containing protein n=1 Tax=Alkalilimnicola ehrlichii TaxID=351052 RepID=A0A3E0WXB1_9GAMM|nr:YrhK family protein [Alkalilimnicola ehrlichii]RFA29995.1 hypothetical protein CAI21_08700 [Alkalilimnicola ehrlichii]RFA36557.1 hypothetical protein CAL65_10970 [Alkalilimnicola ehrlichii]
MNDLLTRCVEQYTWIHTTIGLIGNICFVAGSILFLREIQNLGTVFFIIGSTGMLIGNIGNTIAMKLARDWRKKQEAHEAQPAPAGKWKT